MRNRVQHPRAEYHTAWMTALFFALVMLLTLLTARAAGGAWLPI